MGNKLNKVALQVKQIAKQLMRYTFIDHEMPYIYARMATQSIVDPRKMVFVYAQHDNRSPIMAVESYLEMNFDLKIHIALLPSSKASLSEQRKEFIGLAKELVTASTVFLDGSLTELESISVRPETQVICPASDGTTVKELCSEIAIEYRRFPKPSIDKRMRERNRGGIDLSIVIPAYNAAPTLRRSIGSIISQTYDLSRIELIIVDDCSEDSTVSVARYFAREYPELVHVASTPQQSGSPAAPRNLGLSMARGEYVFFLDADDWLEIEAVERMLAHALDWDSDVLLVKLIGEGGRKTPQSMFRHNQPKADVYQSKVMWTLGPVKLYRRSLIENLRFPETFMPEDVSFVLRAYLTANTVSVAADYDYCHIALTGNDTDNVSLGIWKNVDNNLLAYEDIFSLIEKNIPTEKRRTVLRRLLRQDVCYMLQTIGAEPDAQKAHRQLSRLIELVGPFVALDDLGEATEEERALLQAAFG